MVTARIRSPVLAAASRWLTGQMPQMRAVIAAISVNGRPSQNASKPRYSTTWKRAPSTAPASFSWMVILAWPSIRVTGSIRMVRAMAQPKRIIAAPSISGGSPRSSGSRKARMRAAEGGQPGR